MGALDTSSSDIKFKALGGLDERRAPYNQEGTDFWGLAGMYQAQLGKLERIPGKEYLANVNSLESNTTNAEVWNIHQTNDGSGNIIIQTNQDERVYTLDELMGRAVEADVEQEEITDEDSATMALLAHRETNGTVGGSLGQTDNIFYARKLTDALVNDSVLTFRAWDDSSFVLTSISIANPAVFTKVAHGLVAGDSVTFTTDGALPTGLLYKRQYYVIAAGLTADTFQVSVSPSGSAVVTTGTQSGTHTLYKNASQFDLTAGTYRIEANVIFSAAANNAGSVCGLFNVTDQRFEYHEGTTESIVSLAGFPGNELNLAAYLRMSGQFTITGTKTYEIRQAATNGSSNQSSDGNCCGDDSRVTIDSLKEVYALIKILKMP